LDAVQPVLLLGAQVDESLHVHGRQGFLLFAQDGEHVFGKLHFLL